MTTASTLLLFENACAAPQAASRSSTAASGAEALDAARRTSRRSCWSSTCICPTPTATRCCRRCADDAGPAACCRPSCARADDPARLRQAALETGFMAAGPSPWTGLASARSWSSLGSPKSMTRRSAASCRASGARADPGLRPEHRLMTSPEPPISHGSAAHVGVLLVNLGTPDAPTPAALRRYLAEFLSDPRVVEIPRLAWWPILHGVILRTRPAKSARKYASIWTPEGSPLAVWTETPGQPAGAVTWARRPRVTGAPRHALRQPVASPARWTRCVPTARPACWCCRCTRSIRRPPRPASSTTCAAGRTQARRVPELRFVGRSTTTTPATSMRWPRQVRDHWQSDGRAERAGAQLPRRARAHAAAGRSVPLRNATRRRGCWRSAWACREDDAASPSRAASARPSGCSPTPSRRWSKLAAQGVKRVDVMCPGFAADCLETLEEIAPGSARRLPGRRRQALSLHRLPERPARLDRRAAPTGDAPPAGLGHAARRPTSGRRSVQATAARARACARGRRTETVHGMRLPQPSHERPDGRRAAGQVALGGAFLQDPRAGGRRDRPRPGHRQRPAGQALARDARRRPHELRQGAGRTRTVSVLGLSERSAARRRSRSCCMRKRPRASPRAQPPPSSAAYEPSRPGIEQGRPTKRDRRQLVDWHRWSARHRRRPEPRAACEPRRLPLRQAPRDAGCNAVLARSESRPTARARHKPAMNPRTRPHPPTPQTSPHDRAFAVDARPAAPPPTTMPSKPRRSPESPTSCRHAMPSVRRLPARQGRGREHPPPRRGRDGEGAQVRGRSFAESLLPVARQPGGRPSRCTDADARADARRRASHPAPAQCRAGAQQGASRSIPPPGAKFDPHQHQAISVRAGGCQEANTVVTVLQKGYLIADRVLRPALVTVAAPESLRARAATPQA